MRTIIDWKDGAKETPADLKAQTIIMHKKTKTIFSTFRWNMNINAFFDCAGSSYTFDPEDVYWTVQGAVKHEE
jgi:hypothetical protein